MKKLKTCLIVFNPVSGKRQSIKFLDKFPSICMEYGYRATIVKSTYKGAIYDIIKDAKQYDLVITIGGDGTFCEAVNANIKRTNQLLIGHLPFGSTNDLGKMQGYGLSMTSNLRKLLDGGARKFDLGLVNDIAFVYILAFGKFVDVSYDTNTSLKRKIGPLAYVINGINELAEDTPLYDFSYEIDGVKGDIKASVVLISNADRFAGLNGFYKDVKLDDGYFEVLFCTFDRLAPLIKSLTLAKFDVKKAEGFKFFKAREVKLSIKNKKSSIWGMDGESYRLEYPLYIRLAKDYKLQLPRGTNKLFTEV